MGLIWESRGRRRAHCPLSATSCGGTHRLFFSFFFKKNRLGFSPSVMGRDLAVQARRALSAHGTPRKEGRAGSGCQGRTVLYAFDAGKEVPVVIFRITAGLAPKLRAIPVSFGPSVCLATPRLNPVPQAVPG